MKQHLWAMCFLLLSSGTCFARSSEQYLACLQRAKTQNEMNICASKEAKRADAELNHVYRELLSKARGDSIALAKIKAAERAWIAYRSAYIEAMYSAKDKQAVYGSMYPMEADLLMAKLTRQQIVALKAILKQYGGA